MFNQKQNTMKPLKWILSILFLFAFSLMTSAITEQIDVDGFYQKSECVNYVLPGEQVASLSQVVINHADMTIHNLYKEKAILESPEMQIEEAGTQLAIMKKAKGKAKLQQTNFDQRGDYGSLNRFVLINNIDLYKITVYRPNFGSMNKLL